MHKYSQGSQPQPISDFHSRVTASIVGARGYTGLELVRLLVKHPAVDLKYCYATGDFSLQKLSNNSRFKTIQCLPDSEIMKHFTDIVFLATPAEVSLQLAPLLIEKGSRVIDLSGAFRLKKNDYKEWYNFEHKNAELLSQASYGLVPWVGPAAQGQKLVANPGCYASSILMALLPLVKAQLINPDKIVIDAKSGATGAGKKASENLLFTEVDEDCLPYRLGRHQHLPEIIETVKHYSGLEINPFMSTYLLPIRRGISSAIYLDLKSDMKFLTLDEKIAKIDQAFSDAYINYPFVDFGHSKKRGELLSVRRVVGSPMTQIVYHIEGQKLYLYSAIDNLLKGAASQAVENLNRILDLPLDFGLEVEGQA